MNLIKKKLSYLNINFSTFKLNFEFNIKKSLSFY